MTAKKCDGMDVIQNDIKYIKEALQEIKEGQKRHEEKLGSISVTKWSIGILWAWCAALTALIIKKIW